MDERNEFMKTVKRKINLQAHTVTLQSDTFGNAIFLKSPLVERVDKVYRSRHHAAESGQYLSRTPPKLITIVQVTKKLSNKVYVTLIFPVHGNIHRITF